MDLVFLSRSVRTSHLPVPGMEVMHPAQKGETKGALAGLPEFGVDVSFLGTETAVILIKAKPGVFATGKEAEAHHLYLVWFLLSRDLRSAPGPPHAAFPLILKRVCHLGKIIVEHRTLQQVPAIRMCGAPFPEPGYCARGKHNVGVDAHDPLSSGLGKYLVARGGGPLALGVPLVTHLRAQPTGDEVAQGVVAVVVDNQYLGVGKVMVHAQRLESEPDLLEVVV